MGDPYVQFPQIVNDKVILRKIVDTDIDELFELYNNENVFSYIPGVIKKNKKTVQNMIGHFERDFHKRKEIFLGICRKEAPDELAGVAELFEYQPKVNAITIGYRLRECCWGQEIATQTVAAMVDYLFETIEINRIQAFVMTENKRSQQVLRKNHFVEEGIMRQSQYWKGKGVVDLVVFSYLRADYTGKNI